jgi:hypothetical protein
LGTTPSPSELGNRAATVRICGSAAAFDASPTQIEGALPLHRSPAWIERAPLATVEEEDEEDETRRRITRGTAAGSRKTRPAAATIRSKWRSSGWVEPSMLDQGIRRLPPDLGRAARWLG